MATTSPTHADVLAVACRTSGLPVTVQRRAIFELLAGRTDHPTADQVWEAARQRLPGVSRMAASAPRVAVGGS
jgi:Fe2+ or Zn2+ uptake regulation protein